MWNISIAKSYFSRLKSSTQERNTQMSITVYIVISTMNSTVTAYSFIMSAYLADVTRVTGIECAAASYLLVRVSFLFAFRLLKYIGIEFVQFACKSSKIHRMKKFVGSERSKSVWTFGLFLKFKNSSPRQTISLTDLHSICNMSQDIKVYLLNLMSSEQFQVPIWNCSCGVKCRLKCCEQSAFPP